MRRMLIALVLIAGLGACGPATPSPVPTVADTPSAAPVITAAPTLTPPTAVPVSTPSPLPTAAAGVPLCGIADLKASHGISDGAAGSIFTEVVLVSDATCTIDSTPSLGLQDSKGSPLVDATAAGPTAIELTGGDAYATQVRLANWCGPNPSFPLSLVLWIDSEKLVVGGGSFPVDGMPGCLGGTGVRLEATPWALKP